jgi:hypothetical protein
VNHYRLAVVLLRRSDGENPPFAGDALEGVGSNQAYVSDVAENLRTLFRYRCSLHAAISELLQALPRDR